MFDTALTPKMDTIIPNDKGRLTMGCAQLVLNKFHADLRGAVIIAYTTGADAGVAIATATGGAMGTMARALNAEFKWQKPEIAELLRAITERVIDDLPNLLHDQENERGHTGLAAYGAVIEGEEG